jgi:hypothetical protein
MHYMSQTVRSTASQKTRYKDENKNSPMKKTGAGFASLAQTASRIPPTAPNEYSPTKISKNSYFLR